MPVKGLLPVTINAISSSKKNSGLVITPSTSDQAIPIGIYGGVVGDGKVLGDPDLIAANILSGVNIFGVVGNVVAKTTEKRWASGTATSSSTTSSYPKTISGAVGMANLTVAGLTFKPSYILIYPSNYFSHTIYDSRLDVSYAIDVMIDKNNAPTGYSLQNSSPASVTTTGFTMPVQNTSASYIWIAIE
jgi:hypothetical protein